MGCEDLGSGSETVRKQTCRLILFSEMDPEIKKVGCDFKLKELKRLTQNMKYSKVGKKKKISDVPLS